MAWNGAPWPVWGCAPKSTNQITYNGHRGEIIGEKNGYLIIHCQTCILNHVANLPSGQFLADYYANQFYQFSKTDYVERYERDRAWWEMHHQYNINVALHFLRGSDVHFDEDPWDKRLKVLDVGTGPGIFLDVAKRTGFETYGVEPCDAIAELSRQRGHTVDTGLFNGNGSQSYDMIHMYEVLEHVPDPESFLLDVHAKLITGGVLFIAVPNDYNRLQLMAKEMFGLSDYWLAPPEHLNYFEPKSLQLMVRRAGFKVVDIRTTFPLERFMTDDGLLYVGNDKIGRQVHENRMMYEFCMRDTGKWSSYMDILRSQTSDPYSGTIGREIYLLAIKE